MAHARTGPQSQKTLTRSQARELDHAALSKFGLPGAVLMENAGRGVADCLRERVKRGPVAICCGKGNNAGDGFVVARWLDWYGIPVRLLLVCPAKELAGDAAIFYRVCQAAGLEIIEVLRDAQRLTRHLASSEWIVDALLGTGLTGTVRSPFAEAIAAINTAKRPVLSIDLPSGLDCDTGQPLGVAVRADVTATMMAWKRGFLEACAQTYLGEMVTIDIGVPRILADELFAPSPLQS